MSDANEPVVPIGTIRLPTRLAEDLKALADAEHRSVNKQVQVFIEAGLKAAMAQEAAA